MKVISKQLNSRMCIICGLDNKSGVQASFYNMEDGCVGSIFKFKEIHQSYSDRTHGGMIACMLDELMARTLWVKNPAVNVATTSMSIKYRKPVPYDTILKGQGIMIKETSRMYSAIAKIYDINNNLLAEAEGNYIKLNQQNFSTKGIKQKDKMGHDIPHNISEIDFPND